MAALWRRSTFKARCQCHRATFSTSAPLAISLQWDKNDPEALAEVLPAYPYGPTRWYKQSSKGLYGGQRIQFGNNVGEKFKNKTRRTWHPNIFNKKLWSKALNRHVQVRVSARVLRTIDKLGGLDEYLLGEKEARIKELGESGWWLRWAIMQTSTVKHRFARERQALGLPRNKNHLATMAKAWSKPDEKGEADTKAVALHKAIKVKRNSRLPPIKFRVGPRKHIMLTSRGWVRTRPDKVTEYRYIIKKNKPLSRFVARRCELFRADMNAQQKLAAEHGVGRLFGRQRAVIDKAAKKSFIELEADLHYKRIKERRAKARALRRERKEQNKKVIEGGEIELNA